MPRERDVNRRTFLQYGGAAAATAATVGLAGCGEDDPETDDDPGMDDDDGTPPDEPTEAEMREFTEELPDDPTREELLQHANGLSNALAPWVFLHQQFSIYGVNEDLDWEARGDEDIIVREIETDRDEITITQGTFPTAMDPMDHNDTPTHNVLDQPYEPVLYRDLDGEVISLLATDWERTGEQTVELEIRDDVTFHNGDEMTAADVAYSLNRANNAEISDQAGVIGAIEEATAEDGSVVVELGRIEPAFFRNLTAFGRVMNEEWTEARSQGDLNAGEVNGTGPYELVEFADDSQVVYERYDDYWGDNPGPDGIVFNAVADEGTRVDRLIAGDSDIVTNVNPRDISEVEEEDGIEIQGVPSIRNIFLVMNDAKEPFDSREFRQAMNYAVDVEAIIDSILETFGEPTSQPTLPDHFGHNPRIDPYPYDPERAEELVEASGHAGVEITLHTTTGRYLRDTDIAETAAAQINELDNVTADAELRDTDSLFAETLDGDQETSPGFFLIGWGNPTFDANYTMEPWFDPDDIFAHYFDEELLDLIQQANQTPE